MHNENTYCHMSDACKLLKEKEQLFLQFKAANDKKNEFLKKIGIYGTGEFHRIDYYIDKLVVANDALKNKIDYLRSEFRKQKQINQAISRSCENLNCKDLQKFKRALAEVKKIAEENGELLQGYHKEWANNKLILEIINEVLNDN